jgi:hypothetical protein
MSNAHDAHEIRERDHSLPWSGLGDVREAEWIGERRAPGDKATACKCECRRNAARFFFLSEELRRLTAPCGAGIGSLEEKEKEKAKKKARLSRGESLCVSHLLLCTLSCAHST